MGAAKGLGWAEVPQLTDPIGPSAGLGWLAAGLLVIAAGISVLARRPSWLLCVLAAAASQLMIATSWNDARAGTSGTVLLVATAIYAFQARGPRSTRTRFQRLTRETIDAVRAESSEPRAAVTEADLAHLPAAVADYVRASGAVGRPHVIGFRATISGRIRSGPQAPWMPWVGAQVDTFGTVPSRVFYMDATMKGLPTDVLHAYVGPHDTMQVRLASILTVVDAHGDELDQAETVTLLNDLCVLAPAALVDAPIRWCIVSARQVQASFTNAGHTVTAVLTFDDGHRLVDFESDDRLFSSSDGRSFVQQRWSTPIDGYGELDGRVLGTKARARWHPEEEPPFDYLEFNTDDITYLEPGDHRPVPSPARSNGRVHGRAHR